MRKQEFNEGDFLEFDPAKAGRFPDCAYSFSNKYMLSKGAAGLVIGIRLSKYTKTEIMYDILWQGVVLEHCSGKWWRLKCKL